MYIRESKQKHAKTDEVYSSYRLVESYRNAEGKVRQQTLLNLGSHFSVPKTQWKSLADRVEEIQRGQHTLFGLEHQLEKEAERIAKLLVKRSCEQTKLIHPKRNHHTKYLSVDINSLEHNDVRTIGPEHVALQAAKQVQLDKVLLSLGFTQRQQEIALATIISRLVHPGSELNTHHYLTQDSALDELLGTDFSSIGLPNLYKISDQLLSHKESIERTLYQNEKELFQFEEIITLYDLTNTYFEGQRSQSPKKQYGRSKEKRSDCGLVTLGMVLDSSGFPKKSTIYPGNVSEAGTLEEMLSMLSDNKEAIVVMDAGIATETNVAWLQNNGYRYIVVSRKRNLVVPVNQEKIILKEAKNNQVEAFLVENTETNERELYCHSQAKEAKTKAMVSKASQRYEEELQKLAEGLNKKGCAKKYDKIMERIGRLKEKNRRIGQLYDITVEANEDRTLAIKITWQRNEERLNTKQSGIYCLRSNQKDLDAKTLWGIYTTLTDLESAFRSLKSELGLRPIYHQKETRIDGHLFISIIAYHLLHTIRYQLKAKGIHSSWQTIREVLGTHSRITSTLKLEQEGVVTIRKTTTPNADQLAIYNALNIESRPVKTETAYI